MQDFTIDQAISWTPTMRFLWAMPPSGADGEGEGTPPAGNGEGDGTGAGNSGGEGEGEGEPKPAGKTFTQEEVNALVTRETQKAVRGKLDPKELGFSSAQDMKDFLQKMRDKDEEQKSEAEKEKEQAIKEAREEAERNVLSKANARLIRAEFAIQSQGKNLAIPVEDAFEIAQLQDFYDPQVEEDKVSGFDEDFWTQLKEAKAFLFAEPGEGGAGNIGAGAGGANKGTKAQQQMVEDRQKYPALDRLLRKNDRAGIPSR